MKNLIHRRLRFLPKYKRIHSKASQENVKIGSGVLDKKVFQYEKTNSDPRGTNMLSGNQSSSTISSAGGSLSNSFSQLSFGKKKKGKFH